MDQQITLQMVIFLIAVMGALASVWWRIEGRIEKTSATMEKSVSALVETLREVKNDCHSEAGAAHSSAVLVGQQLAEFRLHCAETYVPKAGLKEMRDELVGRIGDVKVSMDHLSDRMDRVIEAAHQTAPAKNAPIRRSPA